MTDQNRAILFVDGSNWYHALRENSVGDLGRLDYAKISKKLVGAGREWIQTRYYIGAVTSDDPEYEKGQQRFLARLEQETEIEVYRGRIEKRPQSNPLTPELLEFLKSPACKITHTPTINYLRRLAEKHKNITTYKEKGVDVHLAVDMVRLAMEGRYDAAYLLSADGDYVPAVNTVHELGKKVYPACPNHGYALREACNGIFIHLVPGWFDDCYRWGK